MENDVQFDLSLIETRILGCLREKETTTPDYYPLTLNALTNACNQKSNRYPVLELEDSEVDRALESLRIKGWASLVSMANSHVAKHRHKLTECFPTATPLQIAILTELMLRGPQTAGELRQRCERMTATGTIDTVRDTLEERNVATRAPFDYPAPSPTRQKRLAIRASPIWDPRAGRNRRHQHPT